MDQKNIIWFGIVLVTIGLVSLAISWVGTSETLTPGEFIGAVHECRKKGMSPVPIYYESDPLRVFRVECE